MRAIEFIREANKGEKLGFKTLGPGETLFKYKDDPDYYVHFHRILKVEPSPVKHWVEDANPIGVYTFNIKLFSDSFDHPSKWVEVFDTGGFITKDSTRFMSILKYNGSERFIDKKTYTESDMKKDLETLSKHFKIDIKNDIVDRYQNIPWAATYFTALNFAQKITPDLAPLTSHYIKWTNALTKVLNWKVIDDVDGIISRHEPAQTLFLTLDSYDIVKTVDLNQTRIYRDTGYMHHVKPEQKKLIWAQKEEIKKLEEFIERYFKYIHGTTPEERVNKEIVDMNIDKIPKVDLDHVKGILMKTEIEKQKEYEGKIKSVLKKYYKLGGNKDFGPLSKLNF